MSKADRDRKRARRRSKPTDPRVIAAPEAEAANDTQTREERASDRAEDRRVKAMEGGYVNRDQRTGKTVSRGVNDVVSMMARTKDDQGQHLIGQNEVAAVRRLEGLIEKERGASASSLSSLERVSGQTAADPILAQVIRKNDAAVELVHLAAGVGPATWRLLRELCDDNLRLDRWHGVVQRHTGEKNEKAQGGIVRQAFRDLAEVMMRPANDHTQDVRHPLVG
jgi:hypothetical protein